MEFNVPKKLKVGGVDYFVKQVEHCGMNDDFGIWRPQGIIEIAIRLEAMTFPNQRKSRPFCTNSLTQYSLLWAKKI